jgi:hypothetical protein
MLGPSPSDLSPQLDYCSATITVMTTNVKDRCRQKASKQKLIFYVNLKFWLFNLVHRDIVDISTPRLSLAPPLLPNCGRPRMILRLPFLILCWVIFCKQGNPSLLTIPESSSISNAKRTNAGAPWVKDTRASKFNAVEPFFMWRFYSSLFPWCINPQGNPGPLTISESSSISEAERNNAGAPRACDARACKFIAVNCFF